MSKVRERWNRWTHLWCSLMHPEITWPMNGHYQCPKCKRLYRVPW